MPPAPRERHEEENLERRVSVELRPEKQHALHRDGQQADRERPERSPNHQRHAGHPEHQVYLVK